MPLDRIAGLPLDDIGEHVHRPPVQGALDDEPCAVQRSSQFLGIARVIEVILPAAALASAAGSADSTGSPVSVDTAFRVGSISKTFTAAMVMQLVDEGLVDR